MSLLSLSLPAACRHAVVALTPVVCGPSAAARGEATAREVSRFLDALPGHARAGLIAGLLLFEESARLDPRSLGRPFSRLSPAAQERHFQAWCHGPRRHVIRLIKMAVAFGHWELPEVKAAMGYHPERFIAEVSARRLESWRDAIREAEATVLAPDPLRPAPAPAPEVARAR
jgi:hypothetical protein